MWLISLAPEGCPFREILLYRCAWFFQVCLALLVHVAGNSFSATASPFLVLSDVQNIHRTRQSDMIHVYRGHTKFSSRLPLYVLPIIRNKWTISALGDFSWRRFRRHVKLTICFFYLMQVRCKNKYCRDCR